MASVTAVEDSALIAFRELTNTRKYNALFYRLSDDFSTIILDFKGTLTHDELLDRLPRSEPRYVVFDLALSTGEGEAQQSKVTLISWCPNGAPIKQKMVHTSSYEGVVKTLGGVQMYVLTSDLSDLEYDKLVSRAS